MAVLHGANAPLLQKMIEREMRLERQVLQGEVARETITFEEALPEDSKETTLHTQNYTLSLVKRTS